MTYFRSRQPFSQVHTTNWTNWRMVRRFDSPVKFESSPGSETVSFFTFSVLFLWGVECEPKTRWSPSNCKLHDTRSCASHQTFRYSGSSTWKVSKGKCCNRMRHAYFLGCLSQVWCTQCKNWIIYYRNRFFVWCVSFYHCQLHCNLFVHISDHDLLEEH